MSDTSCFRKASTRGFLLAFLAFVGISFLASQYVMGNYPLRQRITVQIKSEKKILVDIYYDIGEGYGEEYKTSRWVTGSDDFQTVNLNLPAKHLESFRIDPLTEPGSVYIKSIELSDLFGRQHLWSAVDILKDFRPQQDIGRFEFSEGAILVESKGNNPYFACIVGIPKISIVGRIWPFWIIVIVSAIMSLFLWWSRTSRSIISFLNLKYVKYFFAVLPIGVFFGFFFRYSVNIPHWDDYGAILDSLLRLM